VKIEGSRVLVTGASSGIGAALAPLLAERGAIVGIVARRRERLEEVLEQCRWHTPESKLWAVDLGNLDAAAQVARDAWDAFGSLDSVVHNAGIPKRTSVNELTIDDVTHVMDVDFHSPVRMTLELLPRMRARGTGQFVFVSSMGGRTAIANESAYNAAKFAMCGFAEAMYIDLYGTGIETKLVLPGPIDTEIWDQPENDDPLFEIEKVPPRDCATDIANAMEDDGFEYYAPAIFPGGLDAKAMVVGKTENCNAYLRGMGQFAATLRAPQSP
jgi:short-subunit dehydrogenase